MAYIKDLTSSSSVQDLDLFHVWDTENQRDVAVSAQDLKSVFGSGVVWSGTYEEYEEAASTIADETVISIYDENATTPTSSGLFYKLNGSVYPVIMQGSGGVLAIEITWVQYQALPTAQKQDPTKVYFVPDKYSTNAEIDDTTTASDSVWSSSKVSSEIQNTVGILSSILSQI